MATVKRYSQDTMQKIYQAYFDEIIEHIDRLKENKSKMPYAEYRKEYTRLYNMRKYFKNKIIKGEE